MARTHQQINAYRQKMQDIRSSGFVRQPEISKAELRRSLAEAVRNTAAMTKPRKHASNH